MSGSASYWTPFLDPAPDFSVYHGNGPIVDVGCGSGEQLSRLEHEGFTAIGVEPMREAARSARREGHLVIVAKAEALPIRSLSCGGVLCKVVLPYTDERRAIAELCRVLRNQAVGIVTLHGFGYSLRYLMAPDEWRHGVYAFRTILNTLVFRVTGRRLPGFMGDTIYQSPRRLKSWYPEHGVQLESEYFAPRFLGQPVFFGHVLRKHSSQESARRKQPVA